MIARRCARPLLSSTLRAWKDSPRAMSARPAPSMPSLGAPDDRSADAAVLLANAENQLANACHGGEVASLLARSALAHVRGARALLRRR